MLKILIVSPTGGYAGIDVCLETLVTGLDRNRFEPIVVFPLKSVLRERFEELGIRCYSLPVSWWFPITFSGNEYCSAVMNSRECVDSIVHIIQDNTVDLVLSNTSVGFDGAFAAALAGVPHIMYLHAKYEANIYRNMSDSTRAFLYRTMGALSWRVVACSRLLHEFMQDYIDNSDYIYNGINISKYDYKERNFENTNQLRLVCVGHYNANKNQEFILDMLRIFKSRYPEFSDLVNFTMIGPGEEAYIARLKSKVDQYGLSDHVVFEGFSNKIEKRLAEFDIYINSSITENLPISVMEAMASGMPVLGSRNDGTVQLVSDSETGYLCDTPYDMSERLAAYFLDSGLMSAHSRAARIRVETLFSDKRFLHGFESLFNIAGAARVISSPPIGYLADFYRMQIHTELRFSRPMSILAIYPKEASATFHIAGKVPLEELERRSEGLVTYVAKSPTEVTGEDIDRADILFCIRSYDDAAYNVLILMKEKNKPCIWYIDDNYFALRVEDGKVIHERTENSLYQRMFTDSDRVVVNSGVLFHQANQVTNRVTQLPTYQIVDEEFRRTGHDGVRIGFMGTLKRDDDFSFVVPALQRLLSEYPDTVTLEFIGYCPETLRGDPRVSHLPFHHDYEEFRESFRRREWDIGLAPLNDTLFNRSKTDNKYREYASLKIAGVYSGIPPYVSRIRNRENGMIAENTVESWYQAIKALIDNEPLRTAVADNAFADVRENYSIDHYVNGLYRLLMRELSLKGGSGVVTGGQATGTGPHIPRVVNSDQLSYSGDITRERVYRIFCDKDSVRGIGMIFTSMSDIGKGSVEVAILHHGEILRKSVVPIEDIVKNQWTVFPFPVIDGCAWRTLSIRLRVYYDVPEYRIGVYENRCRRSIPYRVLHKLGIDGRRKDVLFIDLL